MRHRRLPLALLISCICLALTAFAGPPGPPRPGGGGPGPGPAPRPGPAPVPVPAPGSIPLPGTSTSGNSSSSNSTQTEEEDEKIVAAKRLVDALMEAASGASKPDRKTVEDLVKTLSSLNDDGTITPREVKMTEVYLNRVLKSAKVSNDEIKELQASMNEMAKATNMTEKDRTKLVGQCSAIAESLQKAQQAAK